MTCVEYDTLQKDPLGFRPSFERGNEASWEVERGSRRAPGQQSGEGADGRDRRGADKVRRERDALEKLPVRAEALKRKEDENASTATIDQTTKQCTV